MDDPELFGYSLEQGGDDSIFRPLDNVNDRFRLVLLEQDRGAVVPPRILAEVVEILPGALYPEFYEAFDTCDLLIPAFQGSDYANRLAVRGSVIPATLVGLTLHAELFYRSRGNRLTSDFDEHKAAQGIQSSRRACGGPQA